MREPEHHANSTADTGPGLLTLVALEESWE